MIGRVSSFWFFEKIRIKELPGLVIPKTLKNLQFSSNNS
jgi:hypothetical protein